MKRVWTTILAATMAITLCTTTAVASDLPVQTKQTASMTDAIIEGTFNEIFPDPNLAQAIAKEFKRDVTDNVTIAELSSKTGTLSLGRLNISNLEGIQYFSGINYLNLEVNQISDISALSSLTNLQTLNLNINEISDISPLSSLTNLQSLYLDNNQISDISALSSLTNLQYLNLEFNQISDISALSDLINLQQLYLGYNQVSDISALSGLINLQRLNLAGSQISNIDALNDLTNLQWLNLKKNQIHDISALSDLTNLQYLDLIYNQVSDISALSDLTNLQYLDLSYNQISDINALSDLIKLKDLYLYSNSSKISNISPLKDLLNLQKLTLGGAPINDISVLRSLSSLQYLIVSQSEINDISVLMDLTNLQFLDLDYNKIHDISPLGTLTNLHTLWLQNNQISDISALSSLTNLQVLYLNYNQISDISALSSLTKLKDLYLNTNQISDISVLKELKNLGIGSVYNQTITLPTINLITHPIKITGIDNKKIILNSENGTHDGENIVWNSIGNNTATWNNSFNLNGQNFGFSGTVTQTITEVESENKHNVTVITRYLDGALPDETKTYTVTDGEAFLESFDMLDGYEVYNTALRAMPVFSVDPDAKTVSLSSVDKDYTIELEFDKIEYKVKVTTEFPDGKHQNTSKTSWERHGDTFKQTIVIPDRYTVTNLDQLPADVQVDLVNKTVTIPNVKQDYTIKLVLEKKQHNVTVITRYLDGALPDETKTYAVADGGAFSENFTVLDGYELYNSKLRSQPVFNVNMDTKIVSLDVVNQDYTIELEFDKMEYKVTISTEFPDGKHSNTSNKYFEKHDNTFQQTIVIPEGYTVTNLDQLPTDVQVDLINKTITIPNIKKDYDIKLILEKQEYQVTVQVVYSDDETKNTTDTYTVAHGDSLTTPFTYDTENYRIKNITFDASGVSVNRSNQVIMIDSVTGNIIVTIILR